MLLVPNYRTTTFVLGCNLKKALQDTSIFMFEAWQGGEVHRLRDAGRVVPSARPTGRQCIRT